jgi:hypothetical protein
MNYFLSRSKIAAKKDASPSLVFMKMLEEEGAPLSYDML